MKNRIFCALLCVLLLCSVLPACYAASETVDPSHEASLTLSYAHEETALADVAFDVYRIASVSDDGAYTVIEPYTDYPVDFTELTQDAWAVLANTLMGYVQRDNVALTASGITDNTGKLCFSALQTGLYLVIGTQTTVDGKCYTAIPFFVSLPFFTDASTGTWNYDPEISPKYTVETQQDKKITQKVLKQWNDKGNESKRPKSITVQLLCDGKVYSTKQLTQKNKWSYTWTDLDANHVWTVVEEKQENYTVKLTKNGVTFVLCNSFNEGTPPSPPEPPLPQTGLLWWPVPVLLAAGLLCLAFGFERRKNRK